MCKTGHGMDKNGVGSKRETKEGVRLVHGPCAEHGPVPNGRVLTSECAARPGGWPCAVTQVVC